MDDRRFAQPLEYLGRSWQGYRKVRKGVKKRIRRPELIPDGRLPYVFRKAG